MRKKYASLLCVLLLLFSSSLSAQDFTVGTGTDGNDSASFPTPLPGAVEASRAQYLFRASELQAAGLTRGYITGLKVDVLSANNCLGIQAYKIKIGTTAVDTLKPNAWEPAPAVYYANDYESPVDGVNTYTFSDKFFWNGTSNILIDICSDGGSRFWNNESFNPTVAWTTGLSFNASHTYGVNDLSNICGTTTRTAEIGNAKTRPNLTFSWMSAPPDCAGTPNAGTAVSNKSNVCPTERFNLSLTAPAAVGQTYQWQSSPDNSIWTNISGAVKDTMSASITVATYYRVMVKCTASGLSAPSASVQVSITPGVSGTFIIDNSLVTPGPGQFKSFTDAYNYIKCGINGKVIFNVANTGTPYNEQLIMTQLFGASATNTVTFNGNGATIAYASSNYNEQATVKLNGTDYVTFDNLNIVALSTADYDYGIGVQILNDADYNTIKNCTITANTEATSDNYICISVSSASYIGSSDETLSDYNNITGNTLNGGRYGIILMGGYTNALRYNVIKNNIIKNFYQMGIYMNGNNGTDIENNDIYRPDRTSSLTNDQYNTYTSVIGINMQGGSRNVVINANKIHSPYEKEQGTQNSFYGIRMSYAAADVDAENIISNNLVYDIKGHGEIYAFYNAGSSAVFYLNNTVSIDAQSKSTKIAAGYYQSGSTSWIKFNNNIVSITRTGPGNKYGMYFEDYSDPELFFSDYNDFYISKDPTNFLVHVTGTDKATLADWSAGSQQDTNSVATNPGFINLAANDLHPTSALINDKGAPEDHVTTDFAGVARNATKPDIGAYEFTLQGCLTNLAPGTAYSNLGESACPDKPVTLDLKGNDVALGITYTWQKATSATGPWTNISDPLQFPTFRDTTDQVNTYYRAAVSCNLGTPVYSVPVMITAGGLFPGGTYTIDKTLPTDPAGTKNFHSFNDAVDAISCGIAGAVVFNVKPGVYNEQIRLNNIANTSPINTITFQSANNDAASAELHFAATDFTSNYTVRLDSARYVHIKALTLSSDIDALGYVVDIANSASYIEVSNCIINAAKVSSSDVKNAGINATTKFNGGNISITGNTINEGLSGVYIDGSAAASPVANIVINNNKFKDSTYQYAIYLKNAAAPKVDSNDIELTTENNDFSYGGGVFGIYGFTWSGAYEVNKNKIKINNNTGKIGGVYLNYAQAGAQAVASVSNNKINATGIDAYIVKGIDMENSSYVNMFNNVVSVGSSGDNQTNNSEEYSTSLYSNNNGHINFYNNSFLNSSSPSTYYGAVVFDQAYGSNGTFDQTGIKFYNNIASNTGGGSAIHYQYATDFVKSDYNLLYTAGDVLVRIGPIGNSTDQAFDSLQKFKDVISGEMNSVQYKPVFTNNDDLVPDAANDSSWIMQGRGVQLAGNDKDFNGNPRPTTLTDGVPDLGAYEFFPSVAPPAITGTPAVPVVGATQTFMMGTDTIGKIKWVSGTPPTAVTLQRYSGVLPPALAAGDKSMYYYVHANVTGGSGYKYDMSQYYIDSWMRNIAPESTVKLGATDATDKWVVKTDSKVDSLKNRIDQAALDIAKNFTGMTDGKVPEPPVYVTTTDSSNRGTRFWVPYGMAGDFMGGNGQQMKLYLSADKPAMVTVKVNGTGYVKTYNITGDTTIISDELPKTGANDARLTDEGLFNTGVSVESDNPIGVMAYMTAYSGAVVLPTGSYGNTYTALGFRQHSGYFNHGYSWVNVIADHDNTVVEITPSAPTKGGKQAGVPFTVTLSRGQVYQVLGAFKQKYTAAENGGYDDSYEGYELSGTKVVSIPNSEGKCYPVAVFSGSSGTTIRCDVNNHQNGGDTYLIQQNFPTNAWGTDYLTVAASDNNGLYEMVNHVYRVQVKDPATVVKVNGTTLTGLTNNSWYEYTSRTADYIQASAPVQVCQYSGYFTDCGNDEFFDPGIGETMVYLTPLGHGIKNALFYRIKPRDSWNGSDFHQHLTIVIPDAGLASLKVDGNPTMDTVFAHPQKPGYSVAIKRWVATNEAGYVEADTTFTATLRETDNLGYVYNIGLQIPRTKFTDSLKNVYNIASTSNVYTCAGTPFTLSIMSPVVAKSLTWKLSSVTGMTPAEDVADNNPVAADTIVNDFKTYYVYKLNKELKIAGTGTYTLPVTATYSEDAKSCDKTMDGEVDIKVIDAPKVDYTVIFDNCVNSVATFLATGTTANDTLIGRWNWNFGDDSTSTLQNPTKKWNAAGTYKVKLNAIANDGCTSNEAAKDIEVKAIPVVVLEKDSIGVCLAASATFTVKNPTAGSTYNWYSAAIGGSVMATGTTVTITNVTGDTSLYVSELPAVGCESDPRAKAKAYVLPNVTAAVVSVDSTGIHAVRFKWNAVTNATGYQVSTDNGVTWKTPSSGATGLTHTIAGLDPMQTVTLLVKSLGGCTEPVSNAVSATTYTDNVFVPNTFTPNGDGKNDVLKVYATGVKEISFMIFNQWGQKVFESHDPNTGWDGTFNGKTVTSGVYMYACKVTLADGEVVNKKGSVNVVR